MRLQFLACSPSISAITNVPVHSTYDQLLLLGHLAVTIDSKVRNQVARNDARIRALRVTVEVSREIICEDDH